MKLIFISVLFFFLITPLTFAVNWYPPQQAHIAWDASETVPVAGDIIGYNVYISLTDKADIIKMTAEPIQALDFIIDFLGQVPSNYLAAVSAVLESPDPNDATIFLYVGESELVWSDIAADCRDGKTFGFVYRIPPGKAKNLERKTGN